MSDSPGQDPSETLLSPGGHYRLRLLPTEMRMSHWVMHPRLEDCVSGRPLFSFADPNWSADEAHWLDAATVELKLRRYPGNHAPAQLCVRIDCRQHSGQIGTEQVPWSELEALTERYLHAIVPDATRQQANWLDRLRSFFGMN